MVPQKHLLTFLGITVISFSLRGPLTGVSPLVSLMKSDLGLSHTLIGLITTLPLLMFAVCSPLITWFTRHFGSARTMFAGLLLLTAGECLRGFGGLPLLFSGTVLIGIGIAVGNVLCPVILRQRFPDSFGVMIGIFTLSMSVFAVAGVAIGIPLAVNSGWGWRGTLAVWLLPALTAAALWSTQLRSPAIRKESPSPAAPPKAAPGLRIWYSPVAWAVAAYTGLQSLIFYALVAWLPSITGAKGCNDMESTSVATVYQIFGMLANFISPVLFQKFGRHREMTFLFAFLYLSGGVVLLFGQSFPVLLIAGVLLGSGATIGLAFVFFGLRAGSPVASVALSGMAQGAGYLLAASGPVILGMIHDVSHSWNAVILAIIAPMLFLFPAGDLSARNRRIDI